MTPTRARLLAGTSIFAAGLIIGSSAAGNHGRLPPVSTEPGHKLAARADGNSCVTDAWVNGSPVSAMLIDTGAWDSLYFPAEIARSFGVELNELPTDHQYSTWLGRSVRGTTVRLRSFRIGDVTFADIPALVDDTPLRDKGLIGMGLIKARLHAQLDTETCVLRW